MNNARRLVRGLAILVAAAAVASCGLIVEQKGRENPLDENGPVAPLASFTAQTQEIDTAAGTASVLLSWELPVEKAPTLVYIVRNENARPQSRDDGTYITTAPAADLQYEDASGPVPGKVYHYAAWSTADEETYVGPVYGRASTVPVSALASFSAVATAGDTVELSWALPTTDVPAGMLVLRKEDSAPASITDGTAIPVTMANLAYSDTVSAGKTYHYAAWTCDAAQLRYAGPSASSTSTVVPAALGSFVATATSASSVSIAWTVPTVDAPSAVRLVRKAASVPESLSDGTALEATLSSGAYTDTTVAADTVYWYAAWGLNGSVPSQKVADMANTTISTVTLYPVLDGWVCEYLATPRDFNSTSLYAGGSAGFRYNSLLQFNADFIPTHALDADLSFYVTSAGGSLTVSLVVDSWQSTSVTYAATTTTGFVTGTGQTSGNAAIGANTFDLTAMVSAWASGTTSYGLLLSSSSTTAMAIAASEGSTASQDPALSIVYSEEFAP